MSKASVTGGTDGLYNATIEMKDGTPFVTPVHCADLTEDLSGNVGILEIAGALDKGFNIQPGHDGNAAYNAARDGTIKQVQKFPVTHPTGEVFYNWALFPGWQKWHRPAYRYGTITHVYTGSDKCDVTLDSCYATDTPAGKQLSINPDDLGLKQVPIEYMDCDSAAFSNNDRVIVRFDGPLVVANPWGSPKVIGFEREPKPCQWEPWGTNLCDNHDWQVYSGCSGGWVDCPAIPYSDGGCAGGGEFTLEINAVDEAYQVSWQHVCNQFYYNCSSYLRWMETPDDLGPTCNKLKAKVDYATTSDIYMVIGDSGGHYKTFVLAYFGTPSGGDIDLRGIKDIDLDLVNDYGFSENERVNYVAFDVNAFNWPDEGWLKIGPISI